MDLDGITCRGFMPVLLKKPKILPDTFTVLAANEWIEEVAQISSIHFCIYRYRKSLFFFLIKPIFQLCFTAVKRSVPSSRQ
ncbi:hypothetical protein [Lysinibacillus sp. 3P01SB]|uniref:hypothetical protein n=1 Tax=Lysinibacillus sp. 3P01SB TaxID=3132284 RepID=UPI0039A6F5C6